MDTAQNSAPFDPVCPSGIAPIRIGDKWSALIATLLSDGPMRFSEIRSQLSSVTAKTLTKSLRMLERDGFVGRSEETDGSKRVSYELTPLGRTLLEPIAMAVRWAEKHMGDVLDAREAYDRRQGAPAS
ncbi:helix-turn-helix transcriptional regulator [Streptomyces sp. NBC_00882]|uniref:winged helix-turn-helix transcriptional regulator n=1 Tax=Streptomyces TaxID=1883 RepID=UPI00386ADD09|nr:helix-turn-helix transcriptional regulator [Streptomyces sp. NBC_00882]WSZ55105.1 helix-turn-helix transcriptional regulator [Streptomyces canus]